MTAVSPDLLRRFDVPGPRYTSYPTADRFVEAFGQEDYILALEQRRFPWCHRGTRCTYIAFNFGQVSLPVSRGLAVVNLGCAHMDALLAWSLASALLALAIRYAIVRGMAQCGYDFFTQLTHA